jgi:formamidopyrimidine-DNA glycosylase
MPELPEVECVCLSLQRLVVGRTIEAVRVGRSDVITGSSRDASLLVGDAVARVIRRGKQLALVGAGGGCVSVHLGMSGQLCVVEVEAAGPPHKQRTASPSGSVDLMGLPIHSHVVWRLDDGRRLRFTDPRRFGGVWTFASEAALLAERWSQLGPDALRITPSELTQGLSQTRRGLKAALLDQSVVAGLGNIYVDELLFNAKLHPLTPAHRIDAATTRSLVQRMRTLLNGAIARGGSSLRDYVDGENQRGSQQTRHRVYGRAGRRCKRRGCSGVIESDQIAGRTTAWCPRCQSISS